MAEVGDRPPLQDKISQHRQDLEFYNRMVSVLDQILTGEWEWIKIEPFIQDDATAAVTH